MKKLHPGVKWQFRFSGYLIFGLLGILAMWVVLPFIGLIFIAVTGSSSIALLPPVILFSILVYLFFVIITGEIYARMSYDRWFYEFTKNNLRIEKGIIWKQYTSVPYERVQNIDIRRGIIARAFGFSNIFVQTAGISGYAMAEGYIPGVEMKDAEKIREFMMKKIKQTRGSGL